MTLLEYLKAEQSFDKYILFLVALGLSKAEIGRLTGVSKQGVYNALNRNRKWLDSMDLDVPKLNENK